MVPVKETQNLPPKSDHKKSVESYDDREAIEAVRVKNLELKAKEEEIRALEEKLAKEK